MMYTLMEITYIFLLLILVWLMLDVAWDALFDDEKKDK
jgi:hypothetical protein